MPRPRKDDPQSAATSRIEAAFWRLLEEVGYSEITVRRISQAAGINRNSFYYHYESMEDLARKAFLNNAASAHQTVHRAGGAMAPHTSLT
ncbi:DNA-binding transcriptional repressor FabR [Slackia heliotrinireducens]|uniref:Transcriptional regulator, tetR family n=1 Tax=Slackia heliotrinireducens (strain ATCC 29202 / DSM 20476 / NCTC 11029 / RHS 1) TaxID=471855 RepID=C7N7J2_SLAHD|nr:helix-turn-helix domain-containing protein [Slackia heliotrinireducens]ACV22877.1 transcriptional regulator, tetR family [Slackia heliotrinireducens DSM 20476]VEH01648.1 DNA-binding transcriptional repressor FabR [Slackia heliotrinireducens]